MKIHTIALNLTLFATPAFANLGYEFKQLVGYTISHIKTVDGWYDEDGKSDNNFKGCKRGRIIIFTDKTILGCDEHSYSFSYKPEAIILQRNGDYKMIVGNDVYDMRKVRN